MKKLGIIGCGNMASALVFGLIQQKILKPFQMCAFDIDLKKSNSFQKRFKTTKVISLKECVQQSETLLLAVKPQNMLEVTTSIKNYVSDKQLILSIAAGLKLDFFEKNLGSNKKIIRLMPNTPALVGLAATVFCANSKINSKDKNKTRHYFKAVGLVEEIKNESLMDSVTSLSGSGPAYVFLFLESLIKAGQKTGLSQKLATTLATQTILGAIQLFKQSKEQPSSLIQKVASKGGTTEAGLKALAKNGFETSIEKCIKAAFEKSLELGK